MKKELQFAQTKENLIEKIKQIVSDMNNPTSVRNSFDEWLKWFISAKKELPEIKEPHLFYRAFTIPEEEFYAVQIWEKHPEQPLIRCIKTWYANKLNIQNWAEEIIDKRKLP